MPHPAEPHPALFSNRLKLTFVLFWLLAPTFALAQTISGTIQDSSSAVIENARIEISGPNLPQPLVLTRCGRQVRISQLASRNLFPPRHSRGLPSLWSRPSTPKASLQPALTLSVASQQVTVTVPGRSLAFLNSDPVYRQLRQIGLGQTFRFDNFTLLPTLRHFTSAKEPLTFLAPVQGVVTGAIFYWGGTLPSKTPSPRSTLTNFAPHLGGRSRRRFRRNCFSLFCLGPNVVLAGT